MSATHYVSVLGLAFGDCGKGRFIDALTRREKAHTVVRFNGGGQAGHNVVMSAKRGDLTSPAKLHHTFSQFGAGTFVPGTRTVLLDPMIVHPTALLVEAAALHRIGMDDALARLQIDGRCRITTPYHQAAGRLRELLRGANVHGTCGVGVGETVRHALDHPKQTLRYADLNAAVPVVMEKLQQIRKTLLSEFSPQCPKGSNQALTEEFQTLQDETLAVKWTNLVRALARQCPPASVDAIHHQLTQPGSVLFEGAQGVLLDEWHGFHPHTTWSSINTAAVESAAANVGINARIEHYGVLRTYLTRHGEGPLPTHDLSLDTQLPEPHNSSDGWQGVFRRGHPDAVLLRYSLEVIGHLSGVLISHLDVFQRGVKLKWCESYSVNAPHACLHHGTRLQPSQGQDLMHQAALTQLLQQAQPQYAAKSIDSSSSFLHHLASITSLPVILQSFGTEQV